MKESFKDNLHKYNDLIKESKQTENLNKDSKEKIRGKIKQALLQGAKINETTSEAEMEVFGLQQKKQNLMEKFFKRTRKIEKGEKIEYENAPVVSFDQRDRTLSYKNENGEMILTKEELLTDGEWGMKYTLDETVPYIIQKEYLVSELKREIAEKLDEQIIKNETKTLSNRVDDGKRSAYEAIFGRKENKNEYKGGLLAEKMVKNFLKKLSLVPQSGFEIRSADVYEDVGQKIDFFIHRSAHVRGAAVEESADARNIGIQFTTNTSQEAHERKERQVTRSKKHNEEVDDIVIVRMPMDYVKRLYNTWQRNKTPGGPEKNLETKDKRTIFSEVMKGIMTEEEIMDFMEENLPVEHSALAA